MSRHRQHRTDDNHGAIRTAARRIGWLWIDTAQTDIGFDAILVGFGRVVFTEVKDGQKPMSGRKLTSREQHVHAALKAKGVTVEILTCENDLLMLSRPPRRGSYDDRQGA